MPDWWIGRKHSEETKEKMRLARRGAGNSFFGKKHTKETREKISENRRGKCTGKSNPTFGKPRSKDVREKISKTRIASGVASGSRNPFWKGGVREKVKRSKREPGIELRIEFWRTKVLEKANHMCERCDATDRLHAHHHKSWHSHPALRFRVSNGECLCHSCHSKETVKEAKQWQQTKVG